MRRPIFYLTLAAHLLAASQTTEAAAAPRLRWFVKAAPTSPPPTYGHGMTYDPTRQRVVMFGGVGGDLCCQTPGNDVWEWDGKTWEKATPPASPPGRALAAVAHDPGTGKTLVAGGVADLFSVLGDSWLWDGKTWAKIDKQATPGLDPTPRGRSQAFGVDQATGLMLLAGARADGSLEGGSMYQLQAGIWNFRPETSPPVVDAAAAWSPLAKRAFVFGGRSCAQAAGCEASNLLYTWGPTPGAWGDLSAAGGPGPRWGATLTSFDPAGRVIVLGGRDGSGLSTGADPGQIDVWSFDLALVGGWTHEPFTAAPSPRAFHGAAWDEARQQLVLFGGTSSTGGLFETPKQQLLGDTWVLDRVGQPCGDPSECASGQCVDEVCCEAYCGACQVCNAPGSEGVCTPVQGATDLDSCPTTCDAAGSCEAAKKANGEPCAAGTECAQGQCVDGVCCAQAGCGPCQSCGLPSSAGACAPVLGGVDPDSCPSACDAAGVCVGAPKGQPGEGCLVDGACESGHCVDGVCCLVASCGVCEACGAQGACAPVLGGADPDTCPGGCDAAGQCAQVTPKVDGDLCQDDAECASGHCSRDRNAGKVCCDTACDEGPCQACDGGACAALPAGSEAVAGASCGPYLCPGGDPQCGASCVDDAICTAGTRCIDGACQLEPPGCKETGCPEGQFCGGDGACAERQPPGAACESSAACSGAGALCLSGRCCDLAQDPTCGLSCSPDRASVVDAIRQTTTPAPRATPARAASACPPSALRAGRGLPGGPRLRA